MQIEKVIPIIRRSNIGNVLYKARPTSNFLGVFGLKERPADNVFLETGDLTDLDLGPLINQLYKRFRRSIPKDFALIAYPESFTKIENETFVSTQFHLVDLDLYTYLITIEAINKTNVNIQSTNYGDLFYLDGRLVDYSALIQKNIFNYSFILNEYSPLVPYIYKKRDEKFFTDQPVEDFLFNFKKSFSNFDLEASFNSLEILSNIGNHIT